MAKFKYQPVPVAEGHSPRAPAPSHAALPKVIGAGIASIIVVILLTTSVGSSAPAPAADGLAAASSAVGGAVAPAAGALGVAASQGQGPAAVYADDDDRGTVAVAPVAPVRVQPPASTSGSLRGPDYGAAPAAPAAPTDADQFCADYRASMLSDSNENIIECPPGQPCAMDRELRQHAIGQKGVVLWFTGLSGAGKTTIARALEAELLRNHQKLVYRLDGDNLRNGLSANLGLSANDRKEHNRRAAEAAALFADAGVIAIGSLISPSFESRASARRIVEGRGLLFQEVYLDVTIDDVIARDPKGLYKKALAGEISGFTGISPDAPYDVPTNPDIVLPTADVPLEECVRILMDKLRDLGVMTGGETAPRGLLAPDGGKPVNQVVTDEAEVAAKKAHAETLPRVLLSDIDVNWLQTIAEGWVAPLKGFMRESELLQTIHFNSLLVDEFDLVGKENYYEEPSHLAQFGARPKQRVSQPVPITLAISDYTKAQVGAAAEVALVNKYGDILGTLKQPEIYAHRKEEIIMRTFGAFDPEHPYQKNILQGGDWLIGGEVEVLGRIKYNDGLDKYRLTIEELQQEFERKNGDVLLAFQTRNPTHAGHAHLMITGQERLREQGYKRPILWLSPLGGYTKEDDVPVDVRVTQHDAILRAGMLDDDTTILALWPAPMIYAGPTEVQLHAKSRRVAGASYFVVGRDPAGMKFVSGPHADEDIYDADHGRFVLQVSPGLGEMETISFQMVEYDITTKTMTLPDPERPHDFVKISGSKMRALGRMGAQECKTDAEILADPLTCVPPGFMAPEGWAIVTDYYQHKDDADRTWTKWSRQVGHTPHVSHHAVAQGEFGTASFSVQPTSGGKPFSPWHDLPVQTDDGLYNVVIEISAGTTAKMEMNKNAKGNAIMQDTNDDGSARYYTYGSPTFSYGFIPRTWEDPEGPGEYAGDNDPIDVIELSEKPLAMGKIVASKVLGSLELIDEGETDHKILTLSERDPLFDQVDSMADLERHRPGVTQSLVTWLKLYKTTDGKPANFLTSEEPLSPAEATAIVEHTHELYDAALKDGRLGRKFWVGGEADDDDA